MRAVIFTLTTEPIPRVLTGGRVKVEALRDDIFRVRASIGFMEQPDVSAALHYAERAGLPFRTDQAFYFLAHDDIVIGSIRGMMQWRRKLFLARNSQYAAESFGIRPSRLMEVGGQVIV